MFSRWCLSLGEAGHGQRNKSLHFVCLRTPFFDQIHICACKVTPLNTASIIITPLPMMLFPQDGACCLVRQVWNKLLHFVCLLNLFFDQIHLQIFWCVESQSSVARTRTQTTPKKLPKNPILLRVLWVIS